MIFPLLWHVLVCTVLLLVLSVVTYNMTCDLIRITQLPNYIFIQILHLDDR